MNGAHSRRAGRRGGSSASWSCLLSAAGLLARATLTRAQVSKAIADNSAVQVEGNKFLSRESKASIESGSAPEFAACPQDVQLKWMTEATSSIYAAPVVTDLFADGYKDIVVPSFVHHVEVFQGDNGAAAAGFPAFHAGRTHSSPLMYDIDHDGVQDILLATYEGDVAFFKDNGEDLGVRLSVQRLLVQKDWYVGLARDHVDHSHEDVPDEEDTPAESLGAGIAGVDEIREKLKQHQALLTNLSRLVQVNATADGPGAAGDAGPLHGEAARSRIPPRPPVHMADDGSVRRSRQLLDGDSGAGGQVDSGADATRATRQAGAEANPDGKVSQEAVEAANSLEQDDSDGGADGDDDEKVDAGGEDLEEYFPFFEHEDNMDNLERLAEEQHLRSQDGHDFHDLHGGFDLDYLLDDSHYFKYMDDAHGWGDDGFDGAVHRRQDPTGYVSVDPHITCNVAIGDIDNDGVEDLVVPVSYLFDRAYYDHPQHRAELDPELDLAMYLASGVVVFDLFTRAIKWSVHLDLSTDYVDYRAYIYSSPTLADLDHDGNLEIIVATSVGFVYVLRHDGSSVPGWPVQMGEVQAQVAVADVDGDGWLELLAADTRGSVALLSRNGTVLWDVHTESAVTQAGTFADVNGDGRLEVVFGNSGGEVHVLDAQTGRALPGFPFRTGGKVVAPVTVTHISRGSSLQLLVPAFDGILYVIDAESACADVVDIGDTSFSPVLVEDLDNDGYLDLLVSTMSGHLYAFGTRGRYHPLKTWPAQVPGVSDFVFRYMQTGVCATRLSRAPRDMHGLSFPVEFNVFDSKKPANSSSTEVATGGPYVVKILLTSIDTRAMNAGEQPIIGMSETYDKPGKYSLTIPCPRSVATALIRVEMKDVNGVVYVDEFAQSFHMHFARLLKWIVAAPLLALGLFLLVLEPEAGSYLPM